MGALLRGLGEKFTPHCNSINVNYQGLLLLIRWFGWQLTYRIESISEYQNSNSLVVPTSHWIWSTNSRPSPPTQVGILWGSGDAIWWMLKILGSLRAGAGLWPFIGAIDEWLWIWDRFGDDILLYRCLFFSVTVFVFSCFIWTSTKGKGRWVDVCVLVPNSLCVKLVPHHFALCYYARLRSPKNHVRYPPPHQLHCWKL